MVLFMYNEDQIASRALDLKEYQQGTSKVYKRIVL